jgi:hypothetical protein
MNGRSMHSYKVKATDWRRVPGQVPVVLVRAPFDRHAVGDVITIYTQAVSDGMAKAGHARLTDAYGNRFFEVGDLITRDGTDIHRVVDHNGSDGYPPDGMTVVCVKAPSEPWTQVGEEEFNVCRRYKWVGDVIEGDLPAVGSFHG